MLKVLKKLLNLKLLTVRVRAQFQARHGGFVERGGGNLELGEVSRERLGFLFFHPVTVDQYIARYTFAYDSSNWKSVVKHLNGELNPI